MSRTWLGLVAGLAGVAVAAAEPGGGEKELFDAYSSMNYNLAAKLMKEGPVTVEKRLIQGLCDLYDRSRPNIVRGQQTLAQIYSDESLTASYRCEAGVALARSAQLMKRRPEVYGTQADHIDHMEIFQKVAVMDPAGAFGRDAMFYRLRELFMKEETQGEAFLLLEKFLAEFKGDQGLLTPVCLLGEYEYIWLRSDYPNAIRLLEKGYAIGFANPSEDRSALFRLAFINYKKLNNKPMAVKYLREYVGKHAFSSQAQVAKRFLQELGEEVEAK